MASKIEDMIEEIEDYIDSCKYKPLSNTMILVNKEEIDELLRQLRMKTPEEIKRYQKIISNQEAIMAQATQKATEIVDQANAYSNNLVNEHEIMQQAYAQANEVVRQATEQAQQILDQATNDANNIRISAMQYTDDSLANIQAILSTSIETTQARHDSLMLNMQQLLSVVNANRAELHPEAEVDAIAERAEAEKIAAAQAQQDGLSADML